ncbi:putative T7SS-secreted protein [Streptomyces coeruleorubidus]
MSGRPRDWHPVADSDPIPGDPDRIATLGRQLRKTAEELERQIRNLKAVSEVDSWDSKAGNEFRAKAKGNVKKLEAALKRYDTAADALGTRVTEVGGGYEAKLHANPTDYASDLSRAQEIADAALKDAKDAEERKGAAERSLDSLSEKGKGDKKKLEEQRDTAGDEIAAAREKIAQAKEIRDNAAKRASDAIEAVISNDSLKDGFWDKFDKWVDDVGTWAEEWATYFGVAALAVGWIPVIGQALAGVLGAAATILTLISTVATIIQVIRGDKGLKDLAFTVLGLAMMGVGKAFAKIAGKYAQQAIRSMDKARAAKTPNQRRRAEKAINKAAGSTVRTFKEDFKNKLGTFKLEPGEWRKSMIEPFTEPFSKVWVDNFKTLKPFAGNYQEAWRKTVIRGDGNALLGAGRSFSLADPGVASDLKEIKFASQGLDSLGSVNKISRNATGLSLVGAGVTSVGMALDSNLNPLLD